MLAPPVRSATIDGEGMVVDEGAVSDFETRRAALAERGGSRAAFLYGFDLLELGGEDLRANPWEMRRAILTRLLRKAAPGHACAHGAEASWRKARSRRDEGILWCWR